MKEIYIKVKLPEFVEVLVWEKIDDIKANDRFNEILSAVIKSPKYINLFGGVVEKAKDESLNILAHEIGK